MNWAMKTITMEFSDSEYEAFSRTAKAEGYESLEDKLWDSLSTWTKEELATAIKEGLESPVAGAANEQYWEQLRERAASSRPS